MAMPELVAASRHYNLEFRAIEIWTGNHEPFSRGDLCWGGNRRSGFNVSIGVSLPSPQPKRNNGHRLRHH
jgi:hypothetical protein